MKHLITLLLLLNVAAAFGQQQVLSTQYVNNRMLINPGYAGTSESMEVTAWYRKQWVGIEGAPNTQTFSIQGPTAPGSKSGFGALIVRDEIGVRQQLGIYVAAAQQVQLTDRIRLSLGIQGGLLNYQAEFSQLLGFADDPAFAAGDFSRVKPNIGAGLFLYSNNFHIGFSSPNLIENKIGLNDFDTDATVRRFYYLDMGKDFQLNRDFELKTNTLWKFTRGGGLQFDVMTLVGVRDKIWFGGLYRYNESFDALFRTRLSDTLQLGYSYDFGSSTELSRLNNGSHEVMLNLIIPKLRKR